MAGLCRMHKLRRRAGAGKGRGDLFGDVAGFADTCHNHAPLAGAHQINSGAKPIIKTIRKRRQRFGLGADHPAGSI